VQPEMNDDQRRAGNMSVILVVLPKIQNAKKIRELLIANGFDETVSCQTGAAALNEAGRHQRGLVISGCRLPDMYYTELAENLPDFFELLLIGSASAVSEADAGVMAVTTPIKVYDLLNTVNSMMMQIERRFKKVKKQKTKRSEREENYIKNAKLLLMDRNHLSEEEAHRYIQKCSMDNGVSMVETAQMLLTLIYDET